MVIMKYEINVNDIVKCIDADETNLIQDAYYLVNEVNEGASSSRLVVIQLGATQLSGNWSIERFEKITVEDGKDLSNLVLLDLSSNPHHQTHVNRLLDYSRDYLTDEIKHILQYPTTLIDKDLLQKLSIMGLQLEE